MTRLPSLPGTDHLPASWSLRGRLPYERASSGVRPRVIIDNDFSGDPDDLFQLVHHLLSPSVDIRLIVASHLSRGDAFDAGPHSAAHAADIVADLFHRMGLHHEDLIVTGAEDPINDGFAAGMTGAAERIVAEAMSAEETPLYYAAGGGLTDLALAYLREPRIAGRIVLVWIGGPEHDGMAVAPPHAMDIEYNLLIDVAAARVVFESGIEIWQVPRDAYRQCLVSRTELEVRIGAQSSLGRYLLDEVDHVADSIAQPRSAAGTYCLGDSPLVLLTALQSMFEPDPSSCRYRVISTPSFDAYGHYLPTTGARPMRVYTRLDLRLMLEDFYAKFSLFSGWTRLHQRRPVR